MLYSYGPSTKRWSVEYGKHKICEVKKFIIIIKIDSACVSSAPGNRGKTASLTKKKTGDRAVNSNENNIRRKFRTPNSSLFPVVSNRAKAINIRSLHSSS